MFNIYDCVCLVLEHLDGTVLDSTRSINKLFNEAFYEYRVYKKITYKDKRVIFIPEWFSDNIILSNCIISIDILSHLPNKTTLLSCKFEKDSTYEDYFMKQKRKAEISWIIHDRPKLKEMAEIENTEIINYITLPKEDAKRLKLCKCNNDEICEDLSSCHNFCRCVSSYLQLIRRRYYFERYDNIEIVHVNDIPYDLEKVVNLADLDIYNMDIAARLLILFDVQISMNKYSENMLIVLQIILSEIRDVDYLYISERSIQVLIDHIRENLNE